MIPPKDLSDEALATRAARGDERAFAVLVRRYKEPLYRLLRGYTGDSDEAYEAAHEAFIAAWSALARFDPTRPFDRWLRTIAINKARDRSRRMVFRRLFFGAKPIEDFEEAMAAPDPNASADQDLEDREAMAVLDRAIAGLPGKLKSALILTALQGLSQQEAAATLGVTVKTIETRVHRARIALAKTVDPDLKPKR